MSAAPPKQILPVTTTKWRIWWAAGATNTSSLLPSLKELQHGVDEVKSSTDEAKPWAWCREVRSIGPLTCTFFTKCHHGIRNSALNLPPKLSTYISIFKATILFSAAALLRTGQQLPFGITARFFAPEILATFNADGSQQTIRSISAREIGGWFGPEYLLSSPNTITRSPTARLNLRNDAPTPPARFGPDLHSTPTPAINGLASYPLVITQRGLKNGCSQLITFGLLWVGICGPCYYGASLVTGLRVVANPCRSGSQTEGGQLFEWEWLWLWWGRGFHSALRILSVGEDNWRHDCDFILCWE